MAKINEVTAGEKYTVLYDSGSVRFYDSDKLPKTVVKWLETQLSNGELREAVPAN